MIYSKLVLHKIELRLKGYKKIPAYSHVTPKYDFEDLTSFVK